LCYITSRIGVFHWRFVRSSIARSAFYKKFALFTAGTKELLRNKKILFMLKHLKEQTVAMCVLFVHVSLIPGDQKGLFKLAVQLRKFYISVIYNTATGYVLLVYLTNI
jgi:hypothetical protein